MRRYTRTDLACESFGETGGRLEGVEQSHRKNGVFEIYRLRIRTADAAARLEKPIGNYLTVQSGRFHLLGEDRKALLSRILAEELREMTETLTGKRLSPDTRVLVAGLGNAEMTADAIGPDSVSKLTVTRHLREYESKLFRGLGCCSLSAFAPGVLGKTGIETLEILLGAVRAVRPDVVIVIDALAARSCDRIASTVQICDAGLVPGSGVGNRRSSISSRTLGVPVIALGVPTVVDSATLVYDALEQAEVTEISDSLRKVLENGRSFFVSLKESDVIKEHVSTVLARAIDLAFVGDFVF